MKNITLFIGVAFAFIATSCNPLEETYKELEEINNQNNIIQGVANITLTDDDYKKLDKTYKNFDNEDEAKELIADLLTSKYPVWGEGSLANVTYKLYAPKNTEESLIIYTVTTEDYDSNDETSAYDNFDDLSQIYTLLNNKYPTIENGTLISLTYKYYSGVLSTVNNGFLKVDGEWTFIQGFTDEEYNIMGESYPNFSSKDEAEAKLPIYLQNKYSYDFSEEGDVKQVMYKLYVSGSTDSFIINYIYKNDVWVEYENELSQSLQFGYKSGVWIPDNTIKYTLTDANIISIGNNFLTTSGFEKAADNAAYFKSFERREGDTEYWSDDMLTQAFGWFLNQKDANAKEDQKYIITYITYSGSYGTEDLSLIKKEGVWILNTEE